MPSLETINLGTVPNDGTGDPLRLAFYKTSNNFSLIYDMSNSAYNRANTIFISGLSVSNINATGSLSNTSYLRGDGTWSPISSLAAGSDGQVQYNNSGILSGATGLTFLAGTLTKIILTQSVVNTGLIIGTGYSLTGSNATSMIDLAGTWNTTGTPTALKLNITDTASAAASLLVDLLVGGTSKFQVTKGAGSVRFAKTTDIFPGFSGTNNSTILTMGTGGSHIISQQNADMGVVAPGNKWSVFDAATPGQPYVSMGTITGGAGFEILADVRIVRDAANTLALRNSTSAQTFAVYNTYTDASNYERGILSWESNVLYIGSTKAGTGASRNAVLYSTNELLFQTNNSSSTRWKIDASGNFVAGADNTYDIGGAGNRPKDIVAATNVKSTNFLAANSGGFFAWNNRSLLRSPSDGVLTVSNFWETDFARLQFGGTTSSFPALKRSSTDIQVRLADDSGYAGLQLGSTSAALKVGTHSAIGAETVTGYITIKDSAGTDRKIAVVS